MILKSVFQFRPMPWGSWRLNEFFNVDFPGPIGEVWLLSDYPSMKTKLIDESGLVRDPSFVLEHFKLRFSRFPLLVKLISSSEWLSVQVHPDDELAKKIENEPWGKTECWYFLEDSLIAFLNEDADPVLCTRENSWEKNLTFLKPKKNDFVYIPAGLVHALGPNSTLLEIQQCSDLTYRIYDWGRGRETHLKKAMLALKKIRVKELFINDFSSHISEYFEIHKIDDSGYIMADAVIVMLEDGHVGTWKACRYDTFITTKDSLVKVNGASLVIKLGERWDFLNLKAAG